MGTVSHLKNRSVLKLEGSDAASFLQGLITQDVTRLEKQGSIYSGLLSPQGKILFDFFIFNRNGHFLIDCHKDTCKALMMRLNMYKLRSDVVITDESTELFVTLDLDRGSGMSPDPRCSDLGDRMIKEISSPTEDSEQKYRAKRFELGIADSEEIGSGLFFPHECNFDLLNGLSLTKGCYVGQEIVSRMQHRGTARKRILPFKSDVNNIAIDEKITCSGHKLGSVIALQANRGLAIIRLDRLAKCDETTPVVAGDAPIHLYKQPWANFEAPNLEQHIL